MKKLLSEPGERGIAAALGILCAALIAYLVCAIPAPASPANTLPPDYAEVTIPYHGHPLHCVQWWDGAVGAPSGITCDWVRFHHLGAPS
jgi:hypothetical protein